MENNFKIDFIGIGAPKSGTTWLSVVLEAHPDICFSSMKETSFFCESSPLVHNTLMRYKGENMKDYRLFFKHCDEDKIKGEFSVHYMYDSTSAKKIHDNCSDAKIIAVLRNPVSRFISDYRYRRYMRKEENRSIEDLITTDSVLIQFGMYAKQIERYFNLFPKENIKIIIYEEMILDPLKTVKDVYSFLGVNDSFVPEGVLNKKINESKKIRFRFIMKIMHQIRLIMIRLGVEKLVNFLMKKGINEYMINVNSEKLEYEKVSEETKNKIKNLYLEDISQLEKLLNKDLSSWK